jgi:hypothetical protein
MHRNNRTPIILDDRVDLRRKASLDISSDDIRRFSYAGIVAVILHLRIEFIRIVSKLI